MNFLIETRGDVTVVKVLHSEATLRYAMGFRNFLLDLISEGKNKIIVDLTMTTFMDSTFLGALVYSFKKSVATGGDIRIVRNRLDTPLWTMFEKTNMVKVFKIFYGSGEALESFA